MINTWSTYLYIHQSTPLIVPVFYIWDFLMYLLRIFLQNWPSTLTSWNSHHLTTWSFNWIYIYTHNYITIYTLFFFIPRAGNKTAHKNIPKNTSPMRKKMGLEFWRYRKSEMAEMQSICHETNPARQRCHPNDYYPGISTDYSYIISHLPIKHLQQTLIIKIYLLWLCKQL